MSLKDALGRLSGNELPAAPNTTSPPRSRTPALGAAPKTAPGAMMHFLHSQTDQDEQIKALEGRLQQFEGALPVRRLDASKIRRSQFANRHLDHYRSAAYQSLADDIAAAGRNIQPIRVRKVQGDAAHDYEVVFGHRRLQACQQLGLPVEAIVAEDDDAALFEAMVRENSSRADLSAYEEGQSYKRALECGLYASQRKLAAAVGVTQAHISQVLTVANLPDDILSAFPSPLDIQYRWAELIEQRLSTDRKGTIARARSVDRQRFVSAKQVFEYLTEKPRDESVDVVVAGKKRAVIRTRQGVVSVSFSKHAVDGVRITELQAALERFLTDGGS